MIESSIITAYNSIDAASVSLGRSEREHLQAERGVSARNLAMLSHQYRGSFPLFY